MFGTGPSFFPGNVVKYKADEGTASVIAHHLFTPNMPAIGLDGNLYGTAGSICGAQGQGPPPCADGGVKVLRIDLPHEDNSQHN